MADVYLYPQADEYISHWVKSYPYLGSPYPNYYQHVDEGVSYPDDSYFINDYQVSNTTNAVWLTTCYSGTYGNSTFTPSGITFNIRASIYQGFSTNDIITYVIASDAMNSNQLSLGIGGNISLYGNGVWFNYSQYSSLIGVSISDGENITIRFSHYGTGTGNNFDAYDAAIGVSALEVILHGEEVPDGVPLFLKVREPSESGCTLFINGPEQTETGMPLFIEGHQNYYSGCDLSLQTGQIHDTIPLFLDGLEPVSINKNMNLAIWADGSNGLGNTSKYTTLFMESRGKTSGEIPLFIEGGNFDTRSSNIPLYMNTDGSDQQSTVLTVFNEQLTKFTETTLFTNSAIRHSGNATLFMDAPHSGEQKNSIPFYMNNDQFRTDDVQLTVYNDTSYGESGKTLFLANFVPYDNNIPLFMGVIASGEHNSDIPFYMNNNQFKSSGTSLLLYHELYEPSGVNIPLFISNFDSYSGAVPLFMGVIASGDYNSSIPLHTTCGGYKDDTTDLYISNYQLSQSGKTSLFTTSFWSSNGNAPLFIEGPAAGDILKTIPLYVKTTEISYYNTVSGRRPLPMTIWNNQLTGSRVMDLYIGRSTSDSANIPLVIQGGGIDDRTNTTDLYLHNRVESSGDVPLSLLTGVNIKSIPLVMTGLDPAKDQSGIPLFTYSANNSGIFSTNELFLKSDVFGKTIPLFMNVVEVGYPISNIPLYINNDNEHKMSMSVFLESVRWTSGTQNLFINGLGLQPGAEVSRENISMFLAREVDSASYSMYMHLAAPSGESQVIPMLLEGGTYSQLETTLFLPEAMGNEGSGMNIFTHGF